jgi:heme/copper-type cytochrome/quinol oxidase subunit 3
VLLGAVFLFLQFNEYSAGEFTIADSVFGSVFYMTTSLYVVYFILTIGFYYEWYHGALVLPLEEQYWCILIRSTSFFMVQSYYVIWCYFLSELLSPSPS